MLNLIGQTLGRYHTLEQLGDGGMATAHKVRHNSNTRSSYFNNPDSLNYPVVWVKWYAAEQYCIWAGGHLPTEAQWEYASRGPAGNLYSWGERLPDDKLANVANLLEDTTAIDAYPDGSSPFGVLNMTGNVWEWVFDWYQSDYYQTNSNWDNPVGPDSGEIREGSPLKSGRGGTFWISLGNSSGGMRDWYQADWTGYSVGFRCALPSQ